MTTIFKLIIEDDEGKTTVVPLSKGEVSIGRMEGNSIRLMERNISRRHARLSRQNGAIYIEDLNSFNGVKINGERIDQRIEIKAGDLVEIGDYHLALQSAELEDDLPLDRMPTRTAGMSTGSLAGTVPDFRLPEDILADVKNRPHADAALRGPHEDALNARPTLPNAPRSSLVSPEESSGPIVRPPPSARKAQPVLPPFPSPDGFAGPTNPFFSPNSARAVAEGHALRTEQIRVGPARSSDIPRIICVSTEYAGREFALNRPEIIIGRVEDNDIVIEHRSVSRNHAKVLYDGRVHKIIDLESANGILVNGEEYAITDLRAGDLIELGHVRFRFVPAGESFAPNDEEAQAMLDAGVTPPPAQSQPPDTLDDPPGRADEHHHRATSGGAGGGAGADHGHGAHRQGARAAGLLEVEDTSATQADEMMNPRSTVEIPELDVPADPSTAATVTDTPLSALAIGDMFEPRLDSPGGRDVDAGGPTAPAPAADRMPFRWDSHGGERETRRNDVTSPPAPRANGRPTAAAAAPAPRERTQVPEDEEEDVQPEGGKNKLVIAVVAVVLIVAGIIYVATSFVGAADPGADQQLRALFERGEYDKVEVYYLEHDGKFRDRKAALRLVVEAKARLGTKRTPEQAPPPPPPSPPPEPALPASNGAAEPPPAPESEEQLAARERPEAPAAEAPGEDGKKAKPGRPKKAEPAPAAAPPGPAAAADEAASLLAKARYYELQGRRALLGGDLEKAEGALKLCLKTAEYADCHRQLGILYASRDDTRRAIQHYQRYVELKPDAADAKEVRAFIQAARGK